MHGGCRCTDTSFGPFLVKLSQVVEWTFLDNPLKAAVILVACALFPATHFQSFQSYYSVSTLWRVWRYRILLSFSVLNIYIIYIYIYIITDDGPMGSDEEPKPDHKRLRLSSEETDDPASTPSAYSVVALPRKSSQFKSCTP